MGRQAVDGVYFVAVNRSDTRRLVVFDFLSKNSLFAEAHQKNLRSVFNGSFTCQLSMQQYELHDALLEVTLEGLSAVWLKIG